MHLAVKCTMYKIREMTPSTLETDLPQVAMVHHHTWLTTYVGLVPQRYLDTLSFESRLETWRKNSANIGTNRHFFVAEHDGKIIGYADCGAVREQDTGCDGELYGFYILQEHQQRGIGRLLLEAVKTNLRSRGFQKMLVWVLSANPSRAFYERTGGVFIREQFLEIGGEQLLETGYGYDLGHR